MKECIKCIMYSEEYDKLAQGYADIANSEAHFCMAYDDQIPEKIANDKKKCPYFTMR